MNHPDTSKVTKHTTPSGPAKAPATGPDPVPSKRSQPQSLGPDGKPLPRGDRDRDLGKVDGPDNVDDLAERNEHARW